MNRIVAHFQDGRMLKGLTNDFLPGKASFHLLPEGGLTAGKPQEVAVGQLKALFFVKTFEGNRTQRKTNEPASTTVSGGRRIRVVFKDGEVLVGTTQGYDRSRPGFFVIPVDPASNNDRCFVVATATQQVTFV